ncbi:MAG: hypothetical protein MZV63_14400 [Marinilabiliales bacterium]|nr:hypothetical protein [Marinilabiliales bacterium]
MPSRRRPIQGIIHGTRSLFRRKGSCPEFSRQERRLTGPGRCVVIREHRSLRRFLMTRSPHPGRRIRIALGLGSLALFTAFAFIPRPKPPKAPEPLAPASLRCEYLVDPMGIDMAKPRFFWVIGHAERGQVQSAYQIVVSTDPQAATGRHLGQRPGRFSQVDPDPVRRQGP